MTYEHFNRVPRRVLDNPVAPGLAPCVGTSVQDKHIVQFIKDQQKASDARELARLTAKRST